MQAAETFVNYARTLYNNSTIYVVTFNHLLLVLRARIAGQFTITVVAV